MAFTVQDLHDLIVLLEQRPEWKAELRRVLLGDELLRLPELVEEIGRRIRELAETVQGILESLKAMNERQDRFEQRQDRFEQRLDRFEQRLDRMERDMGELKGMTLEIWYTRRMPAIFGRWLRGGREATNLIAQRLKEAASKGLIPQEDADEVMNADLFWLGKFNGKEVFLIGEVSWKVEADDVERVARRTAIAQRAGLCAVGFAAGQEWTQEAIVMAQQLSVLKVQDTRLIDVTPLKKATA